MMSVPRATLPGVVLLLASDGEDSFRSQSVRLLTTHRVLTNIFCRDFRVLKGDGDIDPRGLGMRPKR